MNGLLPLLHTVSFPGPDWAANKRWLWVVTVCCWVQNTHPCPCLTFFTHQFQLSWKETFSSFSSMTTCSLGFLSTSSYLCILLWWLLFSRSPTSKYCRAPGVNLQITIYTDSSYVLFQPHAVCTTYTPVTTKCSFHSLICPLSFRLLHPASSPTLPRSSHWTPKWHHQWPSGGSTPPVWMLGLLSQHPVHSHCFRKQILLTYP